MGAARIEIFTQNNRFNGYPGVKDKAPVQIENETTSTTATTAGSRHVVDNVGNGQKLFARIQMDELGYVAIGSDPTASASALAYKLDPNVAIEVEVDIGDKFSFIDVA